MSFGSTAVESTPWSVAKFVAGGYSIVSGTVDANGLIWDLCTGCTLLILVDLIDCSNPVSCEGGQNRASASSETKNAA